MSCILKEAVVAFFEEDPWEEFDGGGAGTGDSLRLAVRPSAPLARISSRMRQVLGAVPCTTGVRDGVHVAGAGRDSARRRSCDYLAWRRRRQRGSPARAEFEGRMRKRLARSPSPPFFRENSLSWTKNDDM